MHGFIDHRNDNCNMRKDICDKLFDIYRVEDFMWKTSITSIAS